MGSYCINFETFLISAAVAFSHIKIAADPADAAIQFERAYSLEFVRSAVLCSAES